MEKSLIQLKASVFLSSLILLILFMTLLVLGAETKEPMAKVNRVKGEVKIRKANSDKWQEIKGDEFLYHKDELKTIGTYSTLFLYLSDDTIRRIEPNSHVKLVLDKDIPKINVLKGHISVPIFEAVKGLWSFFKQKFNSSSKRYYDVIAGAMGDYKEEILLNPRWTKVITTQPRFEWREVDNVVNYTIVVYCRTQKVWSKVWSKKIEAAKASWSEKDIPNVKFTTAVYPSIPEISLKTGELYSWEVEMEGTDTTIGLSERVNFVILGTKTVNEINEINEKICSREPNDSTTYFLLGNIYEKEGLFVDAERAYLEAITLEPENSTLYKFLGDLYGKMEAFNLAKEIFLMAKKGTK